MALSKERLQNRIEGALDQCRLDEGNSDDSKTKFASLLASAIIDEIKQAKLNYTTGLNAPNGAVTGSLTSVTIS